MKMAGIIGLGVIACVAGVLMPDSPGSTPETAGGKESASFATAGDQRSVDAGMPDYLSGEMVLLQQSDGHFYAEPMINSVQVDALVDTGASVIALTGEDARAIGLSWNDGDIGVVGQGASGPIEGVVVRLETVELGGFEVHDVDAMIIPEGLHVTLLGQSFLSRIPNVQIEGGRMSLSDY